MSDIAEAIDRTASHEPSPAQPGAAALRLALLESRQRWRQFGALAADLLFETDALGKFTFVAPETILGWPAAALLGQPAHVLLQDPQGPNPFTFNSRVQRRQTWLRTMTGTQLCMALTAVPLLDDEGRQRGVRGVAVNVTEQERASAATAFALRRGEALDRILTDMRQEILAPRMMRAVLDGVMRAFGAAGAAIIDTVPDALIPVLHAAGADSAALLAEALPTLADGSSATRMHTLADGTQVLSSPASTRFGQIAALVVWRAPGCRLWDADDLILAGSITGVVRIVLEHESIQRELARQARTDPLTGLMNRRAFMEDATRRLDRLESEGLPLALMFIDLDGFKQLNDRSGHEAGDSALLITAGLLRRTFRPTDLIARFGGDEFAVWLDGADSLTAAERAEGLRIVVPQEYAHFNAGEEQGIGMSIGIAMRDPGSAETLEELIQRADQAMYEVKRNGRGHWRVSNILRSQP